ncbi:MAG TPA: glycosyltransferase family 2 protein [Candidatus Eisenbacteria bacterium]|nr:glycosyltransferase family 2 protein [Candidatus Eisenbacteria bacterium]
MAATAALVLVAIAWLGGAISYALGVRRIPSLAGEEPLPDASLPSLTIVAASRNEAERVEEGARSLLRQDYPGARVLLVDDRSTDATGEILDRLARGDPRLAVLHLATLPEGWIGKPHALHVAAFEARTEWILFTDGDIQLAADTARRAVSIAVRERADHVAIAPDLLVDSITEAMFVGFFVIAFNLSQRPWNASDPRSRDSIGVGAFNLVRREAYERSGGHARIRYDMIDDLSLGRILKRSGARQLFLAHAGRVRAKWHTGARGLIRGVEKNAFASLGYRALPAFGAVIVQVALTLGPALGWLVPGSVAKVAVVAAWCGVVACYALASREVPIRPWHAVLMPLGGLLFAYAILRSAVKVLARGGVDWRGTHYPLEDLRRALRPPDAESDRRVKK